MVKIRQNKQNRCPNTQKRPITNQTTAQKQFDQSLTFRPIIYNDWYSKIFALHCRQTHIDVSLWLYSPKRPELLATQAII